MAHTGVIRGDRLTPPQRRALPQVSPECSSSPVSSAGATSCSGSRRVHDVSPDDDGGGGGGGGGNQQQLLDA